MDKTSFNLNMLRYDMSNISSYDPEILLLMLRKSQQVSDRVILQPRPLCHDGMNTRPKCLSGDWVAVLLPTVALLTILHVLIYFDSSPSLL
jgi:hypothetical protein